MRPVVPAKLLCYLIADTMLYSLAHVRLYTLLMVMWFFVTFDMIYLLQQYNLVIRFDVQPFV